MWMQRLGVLACLCCALATTPQAWAQTYTPKYSNAFLEIGVGARAAAMGNAASAATEDVTAGYWNPAALVQGNKRYDVAAMHSEYFAGIAKYDYLGFATAIDSTRHLAFSIIRFGVDDIANTLNLFSGNGIDYSKITSFSIADMALLISYAQRIKAVQGLSVGGNIKLINRTAGPFATAWGFGLDAAAYYRRKRLRASLVATDVSSTFNAWAYNTSTFSAAFQATGNIIPKNSLEITLPGTRLGASYEVTLPKNFSVLPTLDVVTHFDGKRNVAANLGRISFDPRVGLELNYHKLVYLRGGVMNLQRIPDADGHLHWTAYPTAGLGLNIPLAKYILQVDYALANIGDFRTSLYSNLISLRFAFDKLEIKY